MTRARRELISLTDTPYYHCIARCVRRAYLCGVDRHSGEDFSHRRGWILDRMATLASMFAIDVCAYAIMSNQHHLVLKADAGRARTWSANEVIDRWTVLFAGSDLIKRYRTRASLGPAEQDKVMEIIEAWRERLCDISWCMRVLNEHIARLANAEDTCTGRFWEGRFRSQALLDEQAVLTCMAYVDLNPIRARIAQCPEQSDFTSIQQRIAAVQDGTRQPAPTPSGPPRYPLVTSNGPIAEAAVSTDDLIARPPCPLLDFIGWKDSSAGIPFRLDDYLELVDCSGRAVRADKAGAIASCLPPILVRLGIDAPRFSTMLCR